jgi:WD40 repeat protein
MLAVALYGGLVKLVDPETGVQTWVSQPTAPSSGKTSLVMSPSGAVVASVVNPGAQIAPNLPDSWQLRDAVTGTVLNEISTHGTVCSRTLEFSPCKRWIASAGDDRRVLIWDLPVGNAARVLETEGNYIYSLSFSGDGTRLAAATRDGLTSIWDTATWVMTKSWHGGANVCFSPTNCNLVATTTNVVTHLWDIATHTVLWDLYGAGNFAVFSPDGRSIATVLDDELDGGESDGDEQACNLLVVNTETGDTVWLLTSHTADVVCASFSVLP